MKISGAADYITQLLPSSSPAKIGATPKRVGVEALLSQIYDIRSYQIQLKIQSVYDKAGTVAEQDYSVFLQFPNKKVAELAYSIVARGDSDDAKAFKLMRWVQDNIKYVSDLENYGQVERWELPTETLKQKSADCEGQAFLLHSLLLNAGVPWERIKTYGGLVQAGNGAQTGGHGWTVYQRETDNEWVILDTCYYPSADSIKGRSPMRYDMKYIDDWFSMSAEGTRDLRYCNSIRGFDKTVGTRLSVVV